MRRVAQASACVTFGAVLLLLTLASPARASAQGFDQVASRLERQFRMRRTPIPGMGIASFFGSVFTKGGVKGLQVAEFDDVGPALTPDALAATLREELGRSWHLFVEDLERDSGETTYIYSRVTGGTMRLLIADLENGELDLVEMRLSGRRMAAWVQNPQGSAAARQRIQ